MKKLLILLITMIDMSNVCSQELLVEANNDFTFKMYKATKPDSLNFFISPFSLNIALSIANEGANAFTRQEIDNLLSVKNISNKANSYSELIRQTTDLTESGDYLGIKKSEDTGKNDIFIANSLWINDAFDIDARYLENIQANYQSEIFSFNKNNLASAQEQFDRWVSKATNQKIPKITGLKKQTMLGIINAIYFMGEWDVPFDIKKTKKKKFHTINGDKIDIEYIREQSDYRYYEDTDIQSIHLPYKWNQFSMIIILPQKRYGIIEVENKLNKAYFKKIDSLGTLHEVILSFPKFKIESEILPKEEIIKMGYPNMFSDKADFTGISRTAPLKIGEIIHKTFIEIDEKKTEAAAVSMVETIITGYGTEAPPPPLPPKVFNADHPFIFLIIDNRTQAILFTGRFVKE